jgi:hypothetical protein
MIVSKKTQKALHFVPIFWNCGSFCEDYVSAHIKPKQRVKTHKWFMACLKQYFCEYKIFLTLQKCSHKHKNEKVIIKLYIFGFYTNV